MRIRICAGRCVRAATRASAWGASNMKPTRKTAQGAAAGLTPHASQSRLQVRVGLDGATRRRGRRACDPRAPNRPAGSPFKRGQEHQRRHTRGLLLRGGRVRHCRGRRSISRGRLGWVRRGLWYALRERIARGGWGVAARRPWTPGWRPGYKPRGPWRGDPMREGPRLGGCRLGGCRLGRREPHR